MKSIKLIQIEKLFGIFDYDLPVDQEDNITIIFSPNGFGKSTILRILFYLYNYQFDQLLGLEFSGISIQYVSGEKIYVKQMSFTEGYNKVIKSLRIFEDSNKNEIFQYFYDNDEDDDYLILGYIENFLPQLKRISKTCWRDKDGMELGISEIILQYRDKLPAEVIEDLQYIKTKYLPNWLKRILDETVMQLIDTSRLTTFYRAESRAYEHINSIERIADTLRESINQVRHEVDVLTQQYESTFPFRLIELINSNKDIIDSNELRKKLDYIGRRRYQLKQVGILEETISPFSNQRLSDLVIDEHNKEVLHLYANDITQKFAQFDTLYSKIKLFTEIIESQFSYKKLQVNRERGLQVSIMDPNNTDILREFELNMLSSGEKHLITLLFDLIFNTKKDSVILIDEPEISLHIAWQLEFFDNIQKISLLNDLKFLVATHSPSIINEQWGCTVDLAKKVEE